MLRNAILASASLLLLAALPVTPAAALTMKECSAKYQDAKKANTLKGQKWNDFRKAQCGDDDAADDEAAAAVTEPATPAAPAAKPAGRAKAAVFPRAVSQKYSDQSAGKARLKTCADQYNANKTANANGELKWIQKGGGYWSQCNTRLKS
ncbi:hypothetical protein ASE63_19975 [Bosea sp. Root381]|uniref:hypothetical protein n=1 Tax=Bosea sp. Root381 TaxID=1736524 RepID=UPI000700D29A|nr:hypothetical protein [Bosea sp. Root381]KRE12055.1 hypothetical protein ASE63_19975 [Bosea sp. Root381]